MTSAADQTLKKSLNSRSESGNYRDRGCALIVVSRKNDFRSISVSLNSRTTFASAGRPCPDRYPVSSVQLTRGITIMSRLHILLAMIATISLFAACNNESRVSGLIDASKIIEIRVTILDYKSREDKLFKTISTPTEIDNLVSFVNEQVLARSNLKSDVDMIFSIQDRTALVDLAFYQSDKYLGTLGLGQYDAGKYFIKYHQYRGSQCCESKAVVIPSELKKKLLDLIGYSEYEFDNIPR
jgi:hypothetical protein